ncbi:MAG TPA: hypothetical protein VFU22_28600 [Roseiflexaceae bacterium]|nr:hypothetical protein [Roseiflexaceae bacterium]
MPLCPTVTYCCDNPGSLWCWACGVECPQTSTILVPLPLPEFPGRDRLLEIDREWRANKDADELVLEMASILEKAGDDSTAGRLYQRISDVNITSINDLDKARVVNEALRSQSRLLNRQRRAINKALKKVGG